MINKRIYAETITIPSDCSVKHSFLDQISLNVVKGFAPNLFKKCRCINLSLQNIYPISNEEFVAAVNASINEVFETGKLPDDYNQKTKIFQASSKALDIQFIKHTISETLEKISYKICIDFLQCENIKQISECWCHLCKKSNKIEFLVYNLLFNKKIIDSFCEKCKKILGFDQKQHLIDIIIRDFEKFESQMINDMKEVFDFLCKLEIYSEDFFSNIESIALSYFKAMINETDQVKLSERFQSLEDQAILVVRFSSYLLNQKDIKKLTCDVNEQFSKYIFEELEKELPNLIELHKIQEIEAFSTASGSINKSSQFFEQLALSFNSYAENELKINSSDNLFQKLNNVTSYLLDLCNVLGKKCKEILIPTFRETINKDANYIAKILAIGIDYTFRKHLEFEMSTIFFLFKLLNSKDIFEAYHSNLLMKRIKHNNGETLLSDLTLAEEIRSYCGDYYTKRFDLLINGAEFSRKCFDSFCNEFHVPDIFNVFLLDSKLLTIFSAKLSEENETSKLPAEVRIISAQYFGFLRDNFPNRKYQWYLQMAEVELKCISNDTTITATNNNFSHEFIVRCNAYCASLILSFNIQSIQTVQEIMEKTNLSVNEVECMLSTLTSPKINLIYKNYDKYSINYFPKKNKIKIPSLTTLDSVINDERNTEYILDNQIDCLIVKTLKDRKLISKNDLFHILIDEIGSQITEAKLTSRLENMERKFLLSVNEIGTITYVP